MTDRSNLGRVFDAYQNLAQMARCIDESAALRSLARPPRILELSRHPTGLQDFLAAGEVVRHPTHVDGSTVLELPVHVPFADGEFDACVVTDAYEHVSPEFRQGLLSEMLRVTHGVVLLGSPHDDEVVNRFDRIVFDFIWGKYAEEFEPLAQHSEFGLESISEMTGRLLQLGASTVAALPCNYVYRWIHQILVYFDFQHVHPGAHLYEDVNRVYNEFLSPYDYREPCYRYLLVIGTDPALDVAALIAQMQGPAETPATVAAAEGVLIDAFRAADSQVSDLLRDYVTQMEAAQTELHRLRADNVRLETIVTSLQAGDRHPPSRREGPAVTPPLIGDPSAETLEDLRTTLANQRWTSHNVKLADGLLTIPGKPEFFATDTRLAAIRRILRLRFGGDIGDLRIADLGCLEGGFAAALALEGATVVGIDARSANLEKADVLRRRFDLRNLSFVQADVKDFNVERFGRFDVVLALGIAYHLDRPAAWLRQIALATRSVLIVDSHVAPADDDRLALMRSDIRDLSPLEMELIGESEYVGRWFAEFDESISDVARADQLWAAWSNHRSFWLTEESLMRALLDAGFDIVTQQHDATVGDYTFYRDEFSRGMYVALKSTATGPSGTVGGR